MFRQLLSYLSLKTVFHKNPYVHISFVESMKNAKCGISHRFLQICRVSNVYNYVRLIFFSQVGDDATRKTKQCKHRAVSQSEFAVVLSPASFVADLLIFPSKNFLCIRQSKNIKVRKDLLVCTNRVTSSCGVFSFHTFHTVSAPTQINKYMLCGKLGHLSFAFLGG